MQNRNKERLKILFPEQKTNEKIFEKCKKIMDNLEYKEESKEIIKKILDYCLKDYKELPEKILIDIKEKLQGFRKEKKRTYLEYSGNICINWLIEDMIKNKISKEIKKKVTLTGCDKDRLFKRKLNHDPDFRIEGITRPFEIKADFTSYYEKEQCIDIKDKGPFTAYVIALDAKAKKFGLIDPLDGRKIGPSVKNENMGNKDTRAVSINYDKEIVSVNKFIEKMVELSKKHDRKEN